MYVAYADPVAAIRAEARRRAARPWPVRICQGLASIWLRHVERRVETAVRELDHPDLLADFERASRHGR